MTYIAHLDPESPVTRAAEAAEEAWDIHTPEWREESLDPEDPARVTVPESFVAIATAQDHRDLEEIIAWEEHSLTL